MPTIIIKIGINSSLTRVINTLQDFINNLGSNKEFMIHGLTQEANIIYIVCIYFFLPLFLMIPIIFSNIFASSSFVGEKEKKTIEGLLYTPITIKELVLGKALAVVVPAILLSWISIIIYGTLVDILTYDLFNKLIFPNTTWLFMALLIIPLIVFLSTMLVILVSQRVKSVKSAQSVSMILVFPIIGSLITQSSGIIILNTKIIIFASMFIAVLNLIVFIIVYKKFKPEKYILNI